jgi:hypothetical protein
MSPAFVSGLYNKMIAKLQLAEWSLNDSPLSDFLQRISSGKSVSFIA